MKKSDLSRFGMMLLTVAALSVSGCVKTDSTTATTAAADTQAETGAADEELAKLAEVARPESLGTITLGAYKGLSLSAEEAYTVGDGDTDSYIEYYVLPSYMESVDGAAKDGDTVNIDYIGKKDGVAFDGGTAEGYDLVLGSDTFIDGFEDGLIGHKIGETVSLDLTFPEDYQSEELAGQAVVFEVKINDIRRTPELTDALAQTIDPEVTSAAEYREKIRKQLQDSADYSARQGLLYNAIQAVVDDSEVKASEEAVDWKVADLIVNYYQPMIEQSYGISLSQMLSLQGQSLEEFQSDLREVAEETVCQMLVMDAIAEKENITISDADLETFAENNHTTLDAIRAEVSDEELRLTVLQNLVADYVVDHATVTYTPADSSEGTTAAGE